MHYHVKVATIATDIPLVSSLNPCDGIVHVQRHVANLDVEAVTAIPEVFLPHQTKRRACHVCSGLSERGTDLFSIIRCVENTSVLHIFDQA